MEIRKSENPKIDFHMIFLWNFPENIDLRNIFSNCLQIIFEADIFDSVKNKMLLVITTARGEVGPGWSRPLEAAR